jgi:putative transposase
MPRHARLDTPGALHHVIIRSVERRDLFADDSDRQRFIEKLGNYILATDCSVYAWEGGRCFPV